MSTTQILILGCLHLIITVSVMIGMFHYHLKYFGVITLGDLFRIVVFSLIPILNVIIILDVYSRPITIFLRKPIVETKEHLAERIGE